MMNLPQPPEGVLDPQIPWSRINPNSRLWVILKARLTGRPQEGENYSSYVNISEADADRLIANMKKDPRGYPSLDQSSGTPVQWMERQRLYQEWLVEAYLENPFREEVDRKIEDRQAAQRIADRLNQKQVEQTVELTTDIVEQASDVIEETSKDEAENKAEDIIEETLQEKESVVVPTTELIPSEKEKEDEQKPEASKKKRSRSLLGSMLKTFMRMENHLKQLIEISEDSRGNIYSIEDAFKSQNDVLIKSFQDTTAIVNKISSAVNLQADIVVKISKGRRDLDKKRLDAEEFFNKEIKMEEQSSSSGNAQVKELGRSSGEGPENGGSGGGAIGKLLGGSALANIVAGKGLGKLTNKVSSKVGRKVTEVALRKALGKDAAEGISKTIGREAAEAGVEKGIGKAIGKKVPLIGLGLGAFFAAERAAKGDILGAALELTSGAASTFPGIGTGASLAIDAALIGRDSGAIPFAAGGLTQRSTFSNNRPGVTDLSPDLFKKMYQYELDYESRNKVKFGKIYADGYQKYFDSPGLIGKLGNLLTNLVDFFKNIASKIASGLGRGARNILEMFNPRTGTTTNEFKDVLPEGNPQLTSRFGPRKVSWGSKNHQGIDIGVDAGSRVTALEDGIVKDIYENFGGHGQAVVVDHQDGTRNIYGHVDAVAKIGDTVKKGNVIATVKYWPGDGAQPSDNTHLHLERRTGTSYKPIDPAQYLNERAEKLKANPSSATPSPIFDWNNEPEKRARGGPVSAGTPYFVGENGPELFVPKQSGFVMNNQQTAGLFDFLPGTGRVMAPKGQQFSGQQTTVDKFLGITVPGSERYTTYGQNDIERYNRVNPRRPLVPGQAMYRSPDGMSQYTAPTTKTQSPSVVPVSPERRRERALRDSIDAARSVQRIPGANSVGGGLLQDTINLGEKELKHQLEMERMMKQINGDRSSTKQIDNLIAMAPLEEEMSNSVMVIRVNNTAPPVVIPSSDDGFEQAPTTDLFSQLHLAAIG